MTTPEASNPGSARRVASRLRDTSLAPTSNSTETATCATTSVMRNAAPTRAARRKFAVDRRQQVHAAPFSAGSSPNASALAQAATAANAMTSRSTDKLKNSRSRSRRRR